MILIFKNELTLLYNQMFCKKTDRLQRLVKNMDCKINDGER